MSGAALKSQSLVLFRVKYICGISGAAGTWRREFPGEHCSHFCLNPWETIQSLSLKNKNKTSPHAFSFRWQSERAQQHHAWLHWTEYNYHHPACERNTTPTTAQAESWTLLHSHRNHKNVAQTFSERSGCHVLKMCFYVKIWGNFLWWFGQKYYYNYFFPHHYHIILIFVMVFIYHLSRSKCSTD